MSCNQKKGNKSLQQMGWRLPAVPREPTPQEVGILAGISKVGGLVGLVVLSCGVRHGNLSGLAFSCGGAAPDVTLKIAKALHAESRLL
jgi:hypothetical protein